MNLRKRIITSLTISIPLLLLLYAEYYWQQISEFAPPIGIFAILIFILLFFGKLFSSAITIYKNRKKLSYKLVAPTLIYLLTLAIIIINPKFLNAESYQAKIKYRGCYEGTMNTGIIYFRESQKFEYKHIGFFAVTTFINGKWRQHGDTLFIEYKDNSSEFVGSKLLLTENWFIRIEGDSLLTNNLFFYRGYCKGAN